MEKIRMLARLNGYIEAVNDVLRLINDKVKADGFCTPTICGDYSFELAEAVDMLSRQKEAELNG